MTMVALVVVERAGLRLALPAARVSSIDPVAVGDRCAHLQQRFGQPPPDTAERSVALSVETAAGVATLGVAGTVTIATVEAAAIAPLPPLLANRSPVAAVVFASDPPLLVLDADAAARAAGSS